MVNLHKVNKSVQKSVYKGSFADIQHILRIQNADHWVLVTTSGLVMMANIKDILFYQDNNVHILAENWLYFLSFTHTHTKPQNYNTVRKLAFVS